MSEEMKENTLNRYIEVSMSKFLSTVVPKYILSTGSVLQNNTPIHPKIKIFK